MIEAYGLALAHLSELKRRKDEERARYDRGLAAPVIRRGPGLITRVAALLAGAGPFVRSIRSSAWAGATAAPSCAYRDARDDVTA